MILLDGGRATGLIELDLQWKEASSQLISAIEILSEEPHYCCFREILCISKSNVPCMIERNIWACSRAQRPQGTPGNPRLHRDPRGPQAVIVGTIQLVVTAHHSFGRGSMLSLYYRPHSVLYRRENISRREVLCRHCPRRWRQSQAWSCRTGEGRLLGGRSPRFSSWQGLTLCMVLGSNSLVGHCVKHLLKLFPE